MKAQIGLKLFKNINVRDSKSRQINISLANKTEGIIGMLPVFKNKKALQKALGKEANISEIKIKGKV